MVESVFVRDGAGGESVRVNAALMPYRQSIEWSWGTDARGRAELRVAHARNAADAISRLVRRSNPMMRLVETLEAD